MKSRNPMARGTALKHKFVPSKRFSGCDRCGYGPNALAHKGGVNRRKVLSGKRK